MLCAEEYTDYNHYCYFISYQKNNVNDFLLDDLLAEIKSRTEG